MAVVPFPPEADSETEPSMQGTLRDHLGKGREEVGWTEGDVELHVGLMVASATQGAQVLERPFRMR